MQNVSGGSMHLCVSKGILQALGWGNFRSAEVAMGLCAIWTHVEAGRGTGPANGSHFCMVLYSPPLNRESC